MDAFHKDIQYALEKLGKSNLVLKDQQYQFLKVKDTGSLRNEIVDYSKAPCLGADLGSESEIEKPYALKETIDEAILNQSIFTRVKLSKMEEHL